MRERLKSQMYFIITPLWKTVICNRINLLFLHLCVKSKLEEQRGHKVVTVMSIEFDLRFKPSSKTVKDYSKIDFKVKDFVLTK